MKKLLTAAAGVLACAAFVASPASAAVGQARTAGDSGKYERNASVVQDGGLTYLFYVRSQQACNRLDGCNPDNGDPAHGQFAKYDLYYKVSPDGGKTYGPGTPAAWNPEPSSDFRGRTIAATVGPDGSLYVFWADGGSQRQLYYVKEDGAGGFFPAALVAGPDTEDIFNVEAVTRDAQILLYTEENDDAGFGVYARQFSGGSAGPANLVEADRNIPKAIVDHDGTVRITYVNGSNWPTVSVFVNSSPDGLTWDEPGQLAVAAKPGESNWDPNLIQKPNGEYYLHYAPDREEGNGSQQIGVTTSKDFVDWRKPHDITPGSQGKVKYWDYWPEGFIRDNQVVLYYTSEREVQQGKTNRPVGIGHIWTDPGFGGLDKNGDGA